MELWKQLQNDKNEESKDNEADSVVDTNTNTTHAQISDVVEMKNVGNDDGQTAAGTTLSAPGLARVDVVPKTITVTPAFEVESQDVDSQPSVQADEEKTSSSNIVPTSPTGVAIGNTPKFDGLLPSSGKDMIKMKGFIVMWYYNYVYLCTNAIIHFFNCHFFQFVPFTSLFTWII